LSAQLARDLFAIAKFLFLSFVDIIQGNKSVTLSKCVYNAANVAVCGLCG